jgi:integrase
MPTFRMSISASISLRDGRSLWAATEALSHAEKTGSEWLFSYGHVNSWIRSLGIDRTSHSFRHSIVDRLLNEDISEKLALRLTGHAKQSIHDKYGSGFLLQKYAAALDRVILPVPELENVGNS